MIVIAFAVILITAFVQGTSLGYIIRPAKPQDTDPSPRLGPIAAEGAIARAQFPEIETKAYAPDGTLLHPLFLERYGRRARQSNDDDSPEAATDSINAHFDLVAAAISAGRAELIRLHRAGDINDDAMHNLERDLDLQELAAESARII